MFDLKILACSYSCHAYGANWLPILESLVRCQPNITMIRELPFIPPWAAQTQYLFGLLTEDSDASKNFAICSNVIVSLTRSACCWTSAIFFQTLRMLSDV